MPTTLFPERSPLVTLSRPSPTTWVLEIHNAPDNRLTKEVVVLGLLPALDYVEREWRHFRRAPQSQLEESGQRADRIIGHGTLIIVGLRKQDKFFSNGFDYSAVVADPTWFSDVFDPFLIRLVTFPMPTVAAINGHCFAAGFMLAMACDYRVMVDGRKRNAWMCMNEIDFGANWPPSFASLARLKISQHSTLKRVALEGHRFTPPEALDAGLVDEIVAGATEDVIKHAIALGESKSIKAAGGAWGLIKTELYRELIETTKRTPSPWNTAIDDTASKHRLAKL